MTAEFQPISAQVYGCTPCNKMPRPTTTSKRALIRSLSGSMKRIRGRKHANGDATNSWHGKAAIADYIEDDKPVISGLNFKAASLDKLVTICVDSFDDNGDLVEKSPLPRVFFLMHKWFVSSEELATKFLELYKNCPGILCKTSCTHKTDDANCKRYQFRCHVCQSVRYWISHFPVHFDLDKSLSTVVWTLQRHIQEDGFTRLKNVVDISSVPSYDWIRHISVRNSSIRHNRKVSLVFNHLEPNELADHLTFLEYKIFRRLTFSDFKSYASYTQLKDNPKLERSIALFNGLSQWIQCMVLSRTTPKQRAEVVAKFVDVARRLRALQNFNTLMAVVGGLTHSALARLGKTNSHLSSEMQKTLSEMTELLSSGGNFCNYRKALQESKGFKIPILGVHLKDLITIHTAFPDRLENDLINFRKMAQLSMTIAELTQLQNATPPIEANMDLVNMLKASLDLHYTEDEIYELSIAREPRTSTSSPPTPTKPGVFADWASGVNTPPDPETINKHVHAMVEAVFKNYDHDRDGFISQEEFEAIAGNFPFMDSFCVLDADKDGMISKSEMKTYFIRANYHALRSSFKHDFHEHTYFKPTFCVHCTGLLWGLIKQGVKCKTCGINSHKHCKDLVVMECRSKTSSTHSHSNGSVDGVTAKDVTIDSKRKMSLRRKQNSQSRANQQSTQTQVPDVQDENKKELVDQCLNEEDDDDDIDNYGESYEEETDMHERLARAEQARDLLSTENERLQKQLHAAQEKINTLQNHIGVIRQHTITFILDQMDTLHLQKDSEV
ncbi:ras guanyl-releasing protein 3-like isoform X1 [Ptychodera flava]|uniref:ras guanyl-releasing protein 3-like isoform X1 n=2 Tax=Ptychodera flava TaxID=63121 RepID=UPI00396A3981